MRHQSPPPGHVHKLDRQLDPAILAELVAAYQAGTPTTELTKTYNLGKGSVLKILAEAGVQMRNQGLSPGDLPEAIRRYEAGESLATIGDHFGCDRTVIRRHLAAAGVQIRPRPGWYPDEQWPAKHELVASFPAPD